MKISFRKRHHSIQMQCNSTIYLKKLTYSQKCSQGNRKYNLFKAKQFKKLMLIVIHHFILHEPGFCLWCGHFPHFDSVLESVKAQVDCFKASHQDHLNKYKVFSFHSLRIIIHKRLQCATSQMGRFVAKWSNFLLICSRNRPDKNMPSYHYTNQQAMESCMWLKYTISE